MSYTVTSTGNDFKVDQGEEYCGCKPESRGKDYFDDVRDENPFKPDEQSTYEGTELLISQECNALKDLLIEKNRRYGDSAINRGQIYDIPATIAIKARINDKLLRLKNLQDDESEDVVQDLIGYFILLRIAQKKEHEEWQKAYNQFTPECQ